MDYNYEAVILLIIGLTSVLFGGKMIKPVDYTFESKKKKVVGSGYVLIGVSVVLFVIDNHAKFGF
jgi:uncharacterized membrane protein SpoIIM required for sporulation